MKFLYASLFFLASNGVIASHFLQPEACPDVTSFNKYEKVFFDAGGCHYDGTCYEAAHEGKFGTQNTWNLIIWVHDPMETKSTSATSGVKKALKTLSFEQGPILLENGRWACIYHNVLGYKTHMVSTEKNL